MQRANPDPAPAGLDESATVTGPGGESRIPLSRPDITELEQEAVRQVLETPHLCFGPKLYAFEVAMAGYVGVRHAVAVNSGTSALHLICCALEFGPGDEVITTPFSFIASTNCFVEEGARPVFVDIDADTLNIDVDGIEAAITDRTKAILGVDVFGRCAEWDQIEAVAQKYGLKVIEDSCESIGAEYDGRRAGSFGDAGCLGFYPNKQMTTGEGGCVLTDRDDIADICRSLRNQGTNVAKVRPGFRRLGFSYRLSDLNCALGVAQLSRLEDILERRAAVAEQYRERLESLDAVECPKPVTNGRLSWFGYVVKLAGRFCRADRDQIVAGLRESGIGCSDYFRPIHLQDYYVESFGYRYGDFPVAEAVSERTIALPFFNAITGTQIDEVVDRLVLQIARVEKRR
jgi:perosamine synthetase